MKAAPKSAGPLTLDVIVDAAIELIHADGFDTFSMRRLAQRCGVAVMTLYGHVRTREEILAAVAERLLSALEYPDPSEDWRQQLTEIFRAVHRMFVSYPELVDIVGRQYLNSRSAFRGAELAFKAMNRAGLSSEDAICAFVSLIVYTTGFAQRQVHVDTGSVTRAQRLAVLRDLPTEEFDRLPQLATLFVAELDDRQFERGLDFMLDGIASRVRR